MRLETQTVRIGEWLGPVDWSFDFLENAPNYGTSPDRAAALVRENIARFRTLAEGIERGERWRIYLHGIWYDVIRVGMYDGWPYWKPYPKIGYRTWLGEDRTSWSSPAMAEQFASPSENAPQEEDREHD